MVLWFLIFFYLHDSIDPRISTSVCVGYATAFVSPLSDRTTLNAEGELQSTSDLNY